MTNAIATQSPSENSQPTATGPTEPSPQDTRSRAENVLNGFLAAMVTIYGVLTALIILAASRAESFANDNNVFALTYLNDSSELNLSARFLVEYDYYVFDQIRMHQLLGTDPEIIKFLRNRFSAEALASLERLGGPDETYWEPDQAPWEPDQAHWEFDQAYWDEVYLHSNVERDLSVRSIDLALAWSQREDRYQALVTVLAVGLAFAAWASLMERTGRIRWLFTIVAALILIGSLGFLGVHLATREPLEEAITFDGNYEDYTFVSFDP